jgi:hypothetical protein
LLIAPMPVTFVAFQDTVSVLAGTAERGASGETLGIGVDGTADRPGVREGGGDVDALGETSAAGVGSVHAVAITAANNKKLERRMIPSG